MLRWEFLNLLLNKAVERRVQFTLRINKKNKKKKRVMYISICHTTSKQLRLNSHLAVFYYKDLLFTVQHLIVSIIKMKRSS